MLKKFFKTLEYYVFFEVLRVFLELLNESEDKFWIE